MSRHAQRARRLQVSPIARARVGFAGGCVTSIVGVALLFGIAVALIVAGVVLAASSLLLVEIGEG